MKTTLLLGLSFCLLPVSAWAGHGGMHGECAGGHFGGFSLALLAALGYWVVHLSQKDSGAVRWAGRAVGWTLLVLGLGGFVCASLHKMKRSSACCATKSMGAPADAAAPAAEAAPARSKKAR